MKILMLAPGTRGDVGPAARIGAGLVADGHAVTIVAHRDHAEFVHAAGCSLAPFTAPLSPPAGPDVGSDSRPGVRAYLAHLRAYLTDAAKAALGASTGSGAIITNPISPYGHDIAEALGVPSAEALLQPSAPSRCYPPMIFSAYDFGRFGNLLAGQLALRLPSPVATATSWVRSELGQPAEHPAAARRRRLAAGVPVHHGIDETVMPRPVDWPDGFTLDGFWWPLDQPGWVPSAELTEFLAGGPAPVLISMGSVDADPTTTEALRGFVSTTDHRVMVQGSGWSDVSVAGNGRVLAVGDVPHSWLLPRTAAIIHHCGAGTTAASLRAGVPSIAVPQHTDQHFWARRLAELGAAPPPLRSRRLTPESIAGAVATATGDRAFRRHAEAASSALGQADSTHRLRAWVDRIDG